LHDLLAEILVRGVGAQVKRGLHHDYLRRSDELSTVRGRIDVTRTVATRSTTRGRLVCGFDEYQPDTPHNRALKSVIVLLIRHGEVTIPRKNALRRLLPYLDAVTLVAPTSIRWGSLTYHRSNAAYRLLLGICELIVRGLLPTQETGDNRLMSWVSDDAMSSLYERFLREYYAVHHPELSPGAPTVAWDLDQPSDHGGQLPLMRTDVTLRRGRRTLIIDAKYYRQPMQTGAWGKATIHSANLYQILAYVKNEDLRRDGSVSGLLLYARTDAADQPDLDVVVQGNRIGARTLGLNRPWDELAAQLEDVVTWLEA
jgi:5-methylcytosine-specific restriction enzyme subunit McrC